MQDTKVDAANERMAGAGGLISKVRYNALCVKTPQLEYASKNGDELPSLSSELGLN